MSKGKWLPPTVDFYTSYLPPSQIVVLDVCCGRIWLGKGTERKGKCMEEWGNNLATGSTVGDTEEEDVRLQNNLEEKGNQSSLPHGSPTRKPQEFVQKKERLWVYEKHGHFCSFHFRTKSAHSQSERQRMGVLAGAIAAKSALIISLYCTQSHL